MSEQLSLIAPEMPPPDAPSARLLRIEFDEWFKPAYPWRRNNPWDEAFTAYKNARKIASAEEIVDGLRRYQFSDDPTYRPMAATWLNKKRWRSVTHALSADPWGLKEFCDNLPASDQLSAAAYTVEALHPVLFATGWPETWRGSLEALNAWLRDRYMPNSIATVIRESVEEFGPRSSLMHFDKRVRAWAMRISG